MNTVKIGLEEIASGYFVREFKINKVCIVDQNVYFYNRSEAKNSLPQADRQMLLNVFQFMKSKDVQFHIFNNEMVVNKSNPSYYFILSILLFESCVEVVNGHRVKDEIEQFEQLYNAKIDELRMVWGMIDRSDVVLIKDLCLRYSLFFSIFIKKFEGIYKSMENSNVAKKMLRHLVEMKHFERLDKESRIAIYGAGKLGRLLLQLLRKKGFEVLFYIDEQNLNEVVDLVPVIRSRELAERRDIDLIIVTPVYDYEDIRKTLKVNTNKEIKSLDEIL